MATTWQPARLISPSGYGTSRPALALGVSEFNSSFRCPERLRRLRLQHYVGAPLPNPYREVLPLVRAVFAIRNCSGLTQVLAVLRSGKYIASAGDDMAVLVWEIATGRVCRLFRGHKQAVHSVDFSACGRFLSSASADGKSPAVIDRSIDRFD